MPLESPDLYGTNADGSKNEDYCNYCFKDGSFTSDETMEQMIETCVPFVSKGNPGQVRKPREKQCWRSSEPEKVEEIVRAWETMPFNS